jgi:hypothetical protein
VKDEPQNRPPWLRNLRSRQEVESAAQEPVAALEAPAVSVVATEASFETSPAMRGSPTRRYVLLLALLLWMNIAVLGCLCMLATERVVP